MGRPDAWLDRDFAGVLEVERLRWVDGDYDAGGAYWGGGSGDYIFRAQGESEAGIEERFVRAKNLSEARTLILQAYPNATVAASADLDSFAQAHLEAALWSSSNDRYEDSPDDEAEMLNDAGYDVSPACEAALLLDCKNFLDAYGDLVVQAIATPIAQGSDYSIERAGHDFWLTRNRHGAGFWDRDLGEVGDRLSEAAKSFGEVDLYVGDDDLVHASNEACEPDLVAGAADGLAI